MFTNVTARLPSPIMTLLQTPINNLGIHHGGQSLTHSLNACITKTGTSQD